MSRVDANIIIETAHVEEGDDLLLFGKWGATEVGEPVHRLPESTTWADIMAQFGIFPSKGQARKAGWVNPIPFGWTEVRVGKLAHSLWIWKPGERNESQRP
jgi:hypothetical protein